MNMLKTNTFGKPQIVSAMRRRLTGMPVMLVEAAYDQITRLLIDAVKQERPLVFRGFGRLTIRRYRQVLKFPLFELSPLNSKKEVGVVFKPSPAMLKACCGRLMDNNIVLNKAGASTSKD